ncbi:MAG: FadR family transcriptional regulator [Chloroflexi bacterium]|nr:MAG: FadR family transcriptional regulator [Chloroflexota bacterium]
MTLTSLTRETLSDQIARQLMNFIVTTNLQPGDLLPSETKLAADFGVSRSVVREAMRSLAAQGAIEVISGKGAIVRPVDDSLLRIFFQRAIEVGQGSHVELMEIRKPLEVQSSALAAQRRTAEEAESILETVSAMANELGNLEKYAVLDVELHLQIAAAAHNQLLYHLISSVRTMLHNVVLTGLQRRKGRDQLERIQTVHTAIARAIEQSDPGAARDAMAVHFDEAMQFINSTG